MSESVHAPVSMLGDGVILLGFALVFVLLFRRLGLGATLGYLVAGALVGPQLLGLVQGGETMLEIAESASSSCSSGRLELTRAGCGGAHDISASPDPGRALRIAAAALVWFATGS